jgi:hypothetical protein
MNLQPDRSTGKSNLPAASPLCRCAALLVSGPGRCVPRESFGTLLHATLLVVSLTALLVPTPAAAEMHNATHTLIQPMMSAGGGRVGGGNPMSVLSRIGSPLGGTLTNGTIRVQSDLPVRIADTTPPAISLLSVSLPAATTATVTWQTNEPATSQLEYGLTSTYGAFSPLATALSLSHAVTLEGLTAQTTYHLRARSADAAGNLALSADVTFTTPIPDTTPPTGSVAINAGAAMANSPAVTLSFSATDNSGAVVQMRCSNDGVTYTPPEPFATLVSWTLTGGDGQKSVSVQFADASGNWSAPASDAIALDATPPGVTISSPLPGAVYGPP